MTNSTASATRRRTGSGRVPHAFVELHIEQGPVLEDEDITIGVVEGVQGISWTELTLTGQSCHAGTTPMRLRHDPGFVAADVTTLVRRLTAEFGGTQVATVGSVTLTPNLVNVVPSEAVLTVDCATPTRRPCSRPKPASVDTSPGRASSKGSASRPERSPDSSRSTFDAPRRRHRRAVRRPVGACPRNVVCRRGPVTTPRCSPGSARRR